MSWNIIKQFKSSYKYLCRNMTISDNKIMQAIIWNHDVAFTLEKEESTFKVELYPPRWISWIIMLYMDPLARPYWQYKPMVACIYETWNFICSTFHVMQKCPFSVFLEYHKIPLLFEKFDFAFFFKRQIV